MIWVLLTVRLMPRADFGELSRAVHGVKMFVCCSWFDLAHHDPEPVEGVTVNPEQAPPCGRGVEWVESSKPEW
ncbi:MAG: hypothetical protein HY694_10085 [Deltaproteobacteria bacterium]|nr:hypothetical protein [Deltaproteobacteria bacterium]